MSTGKKIVILCETDCPWAFTSELLAERGYQVEVYHSGLAALAKIKSTPVDAFIVADKLDDLDGLGLISEIRSFNRKAKIVYVCSPNVSPADSSSLVSDLRISLIILRPVKQSLFVHQIDGLFADKQPTLAVEETGDRNFMSSLGDIYARILPQRIHELSEACLKAKASKDSSAPLEEAKRLAHNMRGTAGSAGFFQIAETAYKIEQALEIFDVDWHQIDTHLAHLQASDKNVKRQNHVESRVRTISKNNILVLSTSDDLDVFKNDDYNYLQIVAEIEPALEAVQSGIIDAVIVDFDSFPPEFSIEAASALRTLDEERTVPLAFVTSDITSLPSNIVLLGASQIMRRPITPEQWHEKLLYLVKTLPNGRSKVLMVDDDPDFCDMVSLTLESAGIVVLALQTADTIVQNIQEFAPDLILLDMTMPKLLGTDVCTIIRSMADYKEVPIFFLTSETTLASRMSAFASGADDYLSKPLIPVELISRVTTRIERMKFIKERMERDALTGLLLRRAFTERLNALLSQAKRQNFSISLALLDVDNFKTINDTFGHDAGDRVLSAIGKLLRKRFRAEDLRGRWGGEEFVLAFLYTDSQSISASLEQLLCDCKSLEFTSEDDISFAVSFSAGVASYPKDGHDLRTLMLKADERLYCAKRAGRSRIVIDGPAPMTVSASENASAAAEVVLVEELARENAK